MRFRFIYLLFTFSKIFQQQQQQTTTTTIFLAAVIRL